MSKDRYMSNIARIVRWRVSYSLADEVMLDCERILSQYTTENYRALVDKVGKPNRVAKKLTNKRRYLAWLVMFSCMSLCLLLPEFLLLRAFFCRNPFSFILLTLLIGILLSWRCFCPNITGKRESIPEEIIRTLILLLSLLTLSAAMMVGLIFEVWEYLGNYGPIAGRVLRLSGTIVVATGILGLIKARIVDCRFRSIYIMSLTVLANCVIVMALFSGFWPVPNWETPYIVRWSAISCVGLIGTGITLR